MERLTTSRRRVFFAITVAIPFLLLVALEFGLRWSGYGADVSLFRRVEIRHKIYYQMNPQVKARYFGNSKFTPSTSPQYFESPKPAGTFRIFCLGESTTAGYPYAYNGAFPAFLTERLNAIFPRKKVEIINLGLTATNSSAALDIAGELADFQPDLIIYYGGHNEFYGAPGGVSGEAAGSLRFLTSLQLKLVHLRTYQLVYNTVQAVGRLFSSDKDATSRRTLMEILAKGKYVPYGSAAYLRTFSVFKENLAALKELCKSDGIPLIVGTQVSNLREQPPFVSGNRTGLPAAMKSEFHRLMDDGTALQTKGLLDSAITTLRKAVAEDSCYADAHYRLAQCLDRNGEDNEALREYTLARDYDELRFRTDTRFNKLIEKMGDSSGVIVADVEGYLKGLSPDSLIGHNLITEHLHPNSRGNFLLAKCFAAAMRKRGLFDSAKAWASADTVSDEQIWEERHLTDFDEIITGQSIRFLTSGWPFRDQPLAAAPLLSTDTLEEIAQQAAIGRIDWVGAHRAAIGFYDRRGDVKDAEKEYEAMLSLFPMDLALYMNLAKEYFKEKRLDEVRSVMLRSLQIYPTLQAIRTLGDLSMQKGDVAGALEYYERMDEFSQSISEQVQNGMALSYAYTAAGRFEDARLKLTSILAIEPGNRPAMQLLQYVGAKLESESARAR
jgi:tetratricopeptide (TPR) repeat protein